MRLPLASLLFVCAPLCAQVTRYRDPVFAQVQRTNNVAYGSAVNRFTQQTEVLRLDLYQPSGDTATERPAVVVVHGGGFVGGDKGTGQMVQQATNLARRGYVAVSINYRLAPNGSPITPDVVTDAMHDCKAAIRWLRASANPLRIDERRIASIGSSAGGYTVLSAAYSPGEGNSGNPGFSSQVACVVDQWGKLGVLTDLEAGEAPVFIVHGTNDPTVPYSNATDLKARADLVGVPAELHPIVGAGHAPWTEYFTNYESLAHGFLWQHLKLEQLAGLTVRPGYASPGSVTFDHFGIPGDLCGLFLAASPTNLPAPGLGTLYLSPQTLTYVATTALPASPRLPTASITLPVPDGLQTATLHWQTLHFTLPPRVLSNSVATTF